MSVFFPETPPPPPPPPPFEIKIMPLYMSGEDLYFVKWPVVSVKLAIQLTWITYKVNTVIWGGLVIRGPRYEMHLTSFWKYLVQISLNIFNLEGPVTECQCVFLATWKILLFIIQFCIFQVLIPFMFFQCNVTSHWWNKGTDGTVHRWRMEDLQRSQIKMGWKTQAKILISKYYLTLTI